MSDQSKYPALAAEDRYRFLSESATDYAFVTFDPGGRVTSWSQGAEQILGYSEAEMLGQTGDILFTEQDRKDGVNKREFETASREGRAADERWHVRKGGSCFWGSGVMTAVRNDAGELIGFAKVMRDLTEKKRTDDQVRAGESRRAFLLEFGDRVRDVTSAKEIMQIAVEMLGQHLRVGRAGYGEVDERKPTVTICVEWTAADQKCALGRMSIAHYGEQVLEHYRSGQLWVVEDALADPRPILSGVRESYKRWNVRAALNVPLVKHGHWVAVFYVNTPTPRRWTNYEMELMRDVADRTWAAVERARAETALRESEEKYRTLFSSIDEVVALCQIVLDEAGKPIDYRCLELNAAFERITGIPVASAEGKTAREILPQLEDWWIETYGRVALQRESLRFENRIAEMDQWFDVYAAPVGVPEDGKFAAVFKDITERKRAEQVLRENEERFRRALEIDTVGVVFFDLNGEITHANDAFLHMSGYSRDDIATRALTWDRLTPPMQAPAHRHIIEQLKETGSGAPYERECIRKDGSSFWGLFAPKLLTDTEGVEFILNISKRKETERVLEQTRQRLELSLDAAQMGLWDVDLINGEARTSLRHDQIFGHPEGIKIWTKEVLWDHVLEEDCETFKRAYECALETGDFDVEARIRWPDGSTHWVNMRGRIFCDQEHKPVRMTGVTLDVTQRKRAEETLRESERQFHAVANLVPDLLWSNDPNGETSWYNQRWTDYSGQNPEQVRGFQWVDATHPDDRNESLKTFLEAIRSGKPLRVEQRIRRKDGVYRWFLVQAEPLRDEKGRIVRWFGAASDIHEQHLAMEARERELDRTKDELRSLAAQLMTAQESEQRRIARELHDSLAQQLALLETEIFQLHQNLPDNSVQVAARLAEVQHQVGSLSQDVRDLSHRLHPSLLEDLGLPAALRSLAEEFERAHGLRLEVYIADNVPQALPLPIATVFYRIAQEALRNVAKHSDRGVPVVVRLVYESEELSLTIQDDGPGFNLGAVRAKGGLGIVSMQERARLVGGNLEIETAPGMGVLLRVVVPWVETSAAVDGNGALIHIERPRVLLADDYEPNRQTFKRILADYCELVGEAVNGRDAVEMAERLRPNLVILDISMPVMGGFDAARLLRDRVPEARILFASQHPERAYAEEAFRLGAQGYIVKRAAGSELKRAVQEVMSGRAFRSPLIPV